MQKEKKLSRASQLHDLQQVIAPSEMIKHQIKTLTKEKRLLQDRVCSYVWYEDVWNNYGPYPEHLFVPCTCPRCNGQRKWPKPYMYEKYQISFECYQELKISKKQMREFIKERSGTSSKTN